MSRYAEGKEPTCPVCNREKMRRRGSRQCKRCAEKPGWHAGTAASTMVDSVTVNGDTSEIVKTTTEHVKTLADLIRVCEIDVTEWEIVEWRAVVHEMGSVPRATRDEPAEKWVRPSTSPVVTPLYSVSAKLRRKSVFTRTMEALRLALAEDIRREVRAPRLAVPKHKTVDSDWLFEFSPFDLHMGKYTWSEETVTNYDTDVAADLFDASLDFLLTKALRLTAGKLDRVLCVFGNDVSHIDTKRGQTTAGTAMDVDTRYIRVFRRICEVHLRAIRRLADVAPVDVVVIPGNHDELTSFHLGEILATRYDGSNRVTVDNGPRLRKYYDYGRNLFGFTHGDSEKVSELPLVMAREVPDRWARCDSREWHIGHKHIEEKFTWHGRQDLFSDKGVRVRRLASLSAHDAWHTKHGYMDRRACDGFVFHRDAGFTDHLSFNVDHFTGKGLQAS